MQVRADELPVDPTQPILNVSTMEQLISGTARQRRFTFILFQVFAALALLLAAAGIYGVLAGNVTERTLEIGIRSALGASRSEVLGLVLRQGMTLAGIGTAIGIGAAVLATRAITTLLFGVSRLDPLTYVGVIALLLGVSAVACWVPAWRASRVDPAVTLRGE